MKIALKSENVFVSDERASFELFKNHLELVFIFFLRKLQLKFGIFSITKIENGENK